MIYGSVCSGIEAASVAWHSLGWRAAWLAEIESYPAAALTHHYPNVPNLGDMTKIARSILVGDTIAPDLLVGGTPCQAFSLAGLREGLDDERGQLTLSYVRLFDAIDYIRGRSRRSPAVALWENVPGVLSSKDNAFGCFLAGLAGEDVELKPAGKKWANAGCVFGPSRTVAWRVLDAQYFGVAQRRRRVFVVASARKGFDPCKVLFESDGVRRDSPPSREAWEETAGTLTSSVGKRGGAPDCGSTPGQLQPVALSVALRGRDGGATAELGDEVAGCLRASTGGGDKPHVLAFGGNNTSGAIDVATARNACSSASGRMDFETETFLVQPVCVTGDITHTLKADGFDGSEDGTGRGQPIAAQVCTPFDTTQITSKANRSNPKPGDPCHPLAATAHPPAIAFDSRQDLVSSEHVFGALGCSSPQAQAVAFQSSQSGVRIGDVHATLDANNGPRRHNGVVEGLSVRRLTPVECERLQGFPDGYTGVPYRGKPAQDGPRYKAIGNSMALPCMAWLGKRIQQEMGA